MNKAIYQIDEVGKALISTLKKCGRHKTFSEILEENGIIYTNERQGELANTLEALGVIESVTYRLPFEIRAELSNAGLQLANTLQAEASKKAAAPHRQGKSDQYSVA